MHKNTVSIILATYQGEKYLAEQLDSLVNQSYPYINIHAFDDNSTDNTIEILEYYQSRFPHITIQRNTSNIGFVKNFMSGIGSVFSEYIALCDQDDIWHKDKISIAMQEMTTLEKEHPDKPILVHSDLEMINENGDIIYESFFDYRNIKLSDKKSLSQILGHNGVMGNSVLMNQNLVVMLEPFPIILKDHDYWIALINEIFGIRKTLSKPLVKYRIHTNNCSNSLDSINNKLDWVEFFQELFSGNAPLPFMENRRLEVIEHLLSNHLVPESDKEILNIFTSYLKQNDTRYNLAKKVIKHGFIKPSLLYRVHFLLNIWTTDRYVSR